MQSKIIEKKGLEATIEVRIPANEVNAGFEKSLRELQKSSRIPGFRPGKVPLSAIRQARFDELQESTAKKLFDNFCPKVLSQNKIHPAGHARLTDLDLKENQEGRFVFVIEVHPEISSVNYKNLKIKKPDIPSIEEVLETKVKMWKSIASMVKISPYKGPAKAGDILTIGFKAFCLQEKAPIQLKKSKSIFKIHTEKEAYHVFNEHVKGLFVNDEKEFDFKFPTDFDERILANRHCRVTLKVLTFNLLIPPEKDEHIAKRAGFSTLDELKASIKESYQKEAAQQIRDKIEDSALNLLKEKNPIDLPSSLIQHKKQEIIEMAEKELIQQNETPYRRKILLKQRDLEFEQEAKSKLHSTYLIQQMIYDLNIQAEEKDIELHIKANFPSENPKTILKNISKDDLTDIITGIKQQKALNHLIKSAELY